MVTNSAFKDGWHANDLTLIPLRFARLTWRWSAFVRWVSCTRPRRRSIFSVAIQNSRKLRSVAV